ncbi:hypothetical protein C8A00DRAFT_29283 [Chaetomidium leptoderma]|uniref:Uncharacterized protein n=1 Tax=Chaetomidium leptoderma TaxID=669021 RepID=A0AAN7A2C9_9PEZI|nr:hypothetical protein C8A00DRAFT_29283 [Chaetomidium leptoderma]
MGDFGLIYGRRVFAKKFAEYGMPFYSYRYERHHSAGFVLSSVHVADAQVVNVWARFDTWPTSIPIVLNARKPGFAGHGCEYSYFFRYPREYDLYGNNPPVAANSSAHLELSHQIPAQLIAYVYAGDPNAVKLKDMPVWPKYTLEKPVNMVWNATNEPDQLNNHIEADTWREEGMTIWAEYPLELDFITPRSP